MLVAFLFSYWVVSFFSYTVSGAHYNPAVSFAFLFKPEAPFNKILFFFYVISQMVGGLFGALLAFLITKTGGFLYIRDGVSGSYTFLG